jgi:hypothetical protein
MKGHQKIIQAVALLKMEEMLLIVLLLPWGIILCWHRVSIEATTTTMMYNDDDDHNRLTG